MTTPSGQTSFVNYFNNSPDVIIRDKAGNIYSFPTDKYNNGNGGSAAYERDSKNWYNGRKWGGYPWSDVNEIASEDYTNNFGVHPRNSEGENCFNNVDLPTLNSQGALPGYTKKSGGTYKDNNTPNYNGSTHDYIIANRGLGYNNWAFSLYLKKDFNGFLEDMLAANNSLFQILLSNDCRNGNQRHDTGYCVNLCNNPTDSTVKNNCEEGAKQWCRDDTSRIGYTYNYAVSSSADSRCDRLLRAGNFDDILTDPNKIACNSNDKITTPYCADIRRNAGSSNMKYKLNDYLYNNYCNSDYTINTTGCSDVRSTCNNSMQIISNTAPYNCKNLINGLNTNNQIMMTSKFDFTNIPVYHDKSAILNSFNTDVEDALCAIAVNKPYDVCVYYNFTRTAQKNLPIIQNAINNSIATGGSLPQNVIDYIVTDYKSLQYYKGINMYPNSNITTLKTITFCEISDPELKTNLCYNIYNNYKTDPNIISSQNKINDFAFCIATNAFMGKSTLGTSDSNNISCVAKRDNPATFAKYIPLAIKYCGIGNNIISPECISYYNSAPSNINNAMNANYTNAATNPIKPTYSTTESFNNCDNNNDSDSVYHDYTFLFIMLICFILVLSCVNSYSNCFKKYHHKQQYQQ